jgi:hypothetical protein
MFSRTALQTCSGSACIGSLSGLKPLLYAMVGVAVLEVCGGRDR